MMLFAWHTDNSPYIVLQGWLLALIVSNSCYSILWDAALAQQSWTQAGGQPEAHASGQHTYLPSG